MFQNKLRYNTTTNSYIYRELDFYGNLNTCHCFPADALFFRAGRGDFDIVLACYHDQGYAPIKVMGIEEGVNIADEKSMLAAIELATIR